MEYDILSTLPDSLITQILLWLPTKDSVKTSVLSSRWRNLWLSVPGLELHSNDFVFCCKNTIKNFTDKFLELNRKSQLQKFKIKYDECNVYLFGINEWIALAINRGAQHLNVGTISYPLYKDFMPTDIFKSKSLVSLKLANVGISNPNFVVSLPCLKIMHLEDILYSTDDPLILEKVISSCTVLEDLTICRVLDDNVPVLRVKAHSLKKFYLRFDPCWELGGVEYEVEIDTPKLKYMNFKDDQSTRVVLKNLSSLFMINIDIHFNFEFGATFEIKKDAICDFLISISSVRILIISLPTLKALYHNFKQGPISKFFNLTRLVASFDTLLLRVLPDFLESFPNLKHLTLDLVPDLDYLKAENFELSIVPRCLIWTLECVEIKEVITGGFINEKTWMKAVRYFIENSLVLEKLILCFSPITNKILDIPKELQTFTKRSQRCEIFSLIHLASSARQC